jgi:hypothetical protein
MKEDYDLGMEYQDDGSPTLLVVSYDPGVTTGWATHRLPIEPLMANGFKETVRDPRFAWTSGELGGTEDQIVDQMVEVLKALYVLGDYSSGDLFLIAMEDFILRRSEMDRSLLSPVRVFSKFERDLYKTGLRWAYVKQSSSDALSVVTDARLQAWNLYKAGSVHARDAQRHGILAARKFSSEAWYRNMVLGLQPKVEGSGERGEVSA